jgi:hypothetical protein
VTDPARRGSLAAKLGVNDDVLLCLAAGEPWLEHGIVEYRYKKLCPAAYREMIDRWGHVVQGPRRYTVTAFLTGAWARLAAKGLLAARLGPATGIYRRQTNTRILYWSLPPGPPPLQLRTWADFAADAGVDPDDWSLP